MYGKREYGDYQTPPDFTDEVCSFLISERHISPAIVVEPTCGVGNFLKSSLAFNARKYYGIEINPEYCTKCREEINDERVEIINADFFSFNIGAIAKDNSLVIGNPPWVTSSGLSSLGSDNIPVKKNVKKLKGLDAVTGESNFDICEYMIMLIIQACRNSETTIAMLCKTSVARNIFKELKREQINFLYFNMFEFDAKKVFGVNASACLMLTQLTGNTSSPDSCKVYSFGNNTKAESSFRFANGQFYSGLSHETEDFDGTSCFEWRQGVKHDCAKIMELRRSGEHFSNVNGKLVDIEPDIVFPLVKSSMFKTPVINDFSKYVIVTQKKVRKDTAHLEKDLPKTWNYLKENEGLFMNRKSAVYRGTPAFSMFGVGTYSFSKYKVGVSGFYENPVFSVLYTPDGKPVMTDDTCYFICFPSYNAAYVAMLLLNSERVQTFLKSIAFSDAKRPYTKKVLQRLDFKKIFASVSLNELAETEKNLSLPDYVADQMLDEFTALPEMSQSS